MKIEVTMIKEDFQHKGKRILKGGGEKNAPTATKKNLFGGCWCKFFSPPPSLD